MTDGEERKNVPLDAIEKSPVDLPGDSGKATSELEALAHERETFRNEPGWLGRPFGGRKEKPGNISGLVIVA